MLIKYKKILGRLLVRQGDKSISAGSSVDYK